MTTHDIDIELPPLPEACIVSYQTDSTMRRMELRTYSDKDMKDYARSAIEADRKLRGEPVAWASFADNGNIRIWTTKKGGVKRLSEQVGQTLRPLYAAPQPAEPCASSVSDKTACGSENGDCDSQPAEPVKPCLTFKYDDKYDCLYVFCDNNEPTEAEENEQGILLWRAYSDGRLVGVTIPNFIGPMSNR